MEDDGLESFLEVVDVQHFRRVLATISPDAGRCKVRRPTPT